jgi:thymidylate synthase (FAD)
MTSPSADPGRVVLIDSLGDDLMVVNAARVSFGRVSTELTDADKGLIGFLMRERHGTPFEHNCFIFKVEAPLFVAREWFRHRIGSFNEKSGRYSVIEDSYYLPPVDAVRTQVGKPGAYTFEKMPEWEAEKARTLIHDATAFAMRSYDALLDLGVAKELARTVLPVGTFTEFYWTVNARSLMNFLSLRNHANAQYEIRVLASQIEEVFAAVMPVTYEAWVNAGRVAP